MGRLTKEMKKAELMEQLTEANETYLEKISQHMECQYREMQRVERRIERKKKLIDKKYIVSINKLEKERKEKLKKIVGRYRRIKEKVREATIDKVDLAEIENIEKGYITLRQFLLNILRERETGKLPNWKERITERSVESEISTDGGAVVSKLRALQYEFTSKFNIVMGQMPDSDVSAYSYLSRGGYIYLTEQNCEFFKLFMGNDEDCEHIEYDIIGCIKSKKVEELDDRVKDQIKEGMYSLANNPRTKFEESIIENRLTELFGTGSGKTEEALQSLITMVNEMQSLQCTSEGQRVIFEMVTKALDKCRDKVTEEYRTYMSLYREEFCDLKVVDGEVYYYENTYYMHLTKDQIIELYKLRVDPKLHGAVNLRNYRDLYDYIKMEQILKYEMPKNEKLYCPFENGILFVKKGRFEDHDPEFVTFTCLNAKYNEDVESPEEADCPVFDKFMKEISGGRKDIEERLWMALGYLLVEPARGKFFFIMGYARDSGKSIWGNFVQKLFPEEAISNLSLRELGGKFETESLLDARINISLDLPRERLDVSAVSKLKRITGGDGVEIQRKNQRSKKLHRRIKFLFASNFPLEIEGEDEAFFKRVVYLPFTHSIPDDEQNPNLEKKIWKERNEIVTKATFYARRLEELDWHFPEIPDVDSMKGVQRKPPIDYLWEFINLHCEKVNHETFCPTTDLKNAYENYCEEKGVCPCSPIVINKCVIKFGGEHDRKRLNSSENAVWGFYGIKLRP